MVHGVKLVTEVKTGLEGQLLGLEEGRTRERGARRLSGL